MVKSTVADPAVIVLAPGQTVTVARGSPVDVAVGPLSTAPVATVGVLAVEACVRDVIWIVVDPTDLSKVPVAA